MKHICLLKFFLFFYVLACLELFNPSFLPITSTQYKAFQSVFFVAMCFLLVKGKLYINAYSKGFAVIVGAMLLSVYMASTMHESQSIIESVRATLPRLFAYSLFFLLCKMRLDIKVAEKIVLILGFVSALQVLQVWALFPSPFFGSFFVHPARGVRMVASGDTFKICLLFFSLNMLLIRVKKAYIIILGICVLSVVLGLVRQVMLITACLMFLFVFYKLNVMKKILFCTALVVAFQFVQEMEFYQNSMAYTEYENDKFKGEENIRVTAYRYYIDGSQVNLLTRILGNGCFAETSAYGKKSLREEVRTKCFPTDVGIAYFYHVYGIFGILGLGMLVWSTWKIIIPFRYMYLKYSLYYMMLASVASGPILYYSQCIAIPFICYLLSEANKLTVECEFQRGT